MRTRTQSLPPITTNTRRTRNQSRSQIRNMVSGLQVNPFHDIIDLKSANGKKLFYKATQGLETKFDGSSEKLIQFIYAVKYSAENFSFLTCTLNITQGTESIDFLEQPGKLKFQSVKDHCTDFWTIAASRY